MSSNKLQQRLVKKECNFEDICLNFKAMPIYSMSWLVPARIFRLEESPPTRCMLTASNDIGKAGCHFDSAKREQFLSCRCFASQIWGRNTTNFGQLSSQLGKVPKINYKKLDSETLARGPISIPNSNLSGQRLYPRKKKSYSKWTGSSCFVQTLLKGGGKGKTVVLGAKKKTRYSGPKNYLYNFPGSSQHCGFGPVWFDQMKSKQQQTLR